MKTIALKGDFVRKEGVASGAITPGDMVEFGGANDVQRQSTAQAVAPRRAFALENDLIGRGITDDYAAGETVQYGVFTPGAEVYANLAAGKTCTKGQALEAVASGKVQPFTTGTKIGYALETVSAAGGRVKLEVN